MISKELEIPFYAKASIFLVGLFVFLTILYITQDIIIPIVFAIIIAIVLHPVVNFFIKKRIPKVIAILITITLTFYPNPFNSKLTIIMHTNIQNENNEFIIFNSSGDIILHSLLNEQISIFDTSNFSSDIYLYQVIQNKNIIQSGKLISKK